MGHSCRQVAKDSFVCDSCNFSGDMKEMVAHVVANQFVVTR